MAENWPQILNREPSRLKDLRRRERLSLEVRTVLLSSDLAKAEALEIAIRELLDAPAGKESND